MGSSNQLMLGNDSPHQTNLARDLAASGIEGDRAAIGEDEQLWVVVFEAYCQTVGEHLLEDACDHYEGCELNVAGQPVRR